MTLCYDQNVGLNKERLTMKSNEELAQELEEKKQGFRNRILEKEKLVSETQLLLNRGSNSGGVILPTTVVKPSYGNDPVSSDVENISIE